MIDKIQLTPITKVNSQQSIIGISLLVKLIESYSVDASTILTKSGINPNMLVDPKASVSFQQ